MEAAKDPELIRVLIPLLIIVFIIAVGVVLLYQHFQKNLFLHRLKQETMKSNHQTELLRANIQAQDEESKRIAQDIHDELGAVLSIMRMNMLMLERQNAGALPNIVEGLQNVRSLTESALTSMRHISHRLMPPQLEAFGLVKTLESVTAQINNAGKLRIDLLVPQALTMPWPVSLGLYRVVMELINNTIKHADADKASIKLFEKDDHVILIYADNGKGLNEGATERGLGFKSIDGRITVLNGTFELAQPAWGGFDAMVKVPLPK